MKRFPGAICLLILTGPLSGCGNQMFRQLSYAPLDTPRASSPIHSIPVSAALAPDDARAVVSPAYGDQEISTVSTLPGNFPLREPDLPPPNLSDNARNMAAPSSVDRLISPIPLDNAHILYAGNVLFLNRCVQCHNAGGYGYGVVGSYLLPHPPDLASDLVQRNSDGAIFWHITMGQGKMPGFKNWTTPVERWAMTAYVRSLKGATPSVQKLLAAHVSDTSGSPYPVYGESGFERGRNTAPFKVLGGAAPPGTSRVTTVSSEPEGLIDGSTN